jgi:hypothetical protein
MQNTFAVLSRSRLRRVAGVLALCPFVLLAACASVSAGADFEPGVRLTTYPTFEWGGGDTLPVGDPRYDNNPFFDSRVRAAVERELTARGVQRSGTSPTLLVHYHASVRQRVDVIKADEGRGYTSPSYGEAARVSEFEEGTLIVDVADARTKKILWRGWSQTNVSGLLENQREMEKRINESVRLMMLRFPPTR